MGFLDLFRPKWRHSSAEVRAEAVRHLGADEASLLAHIGKKDQDARVRRLAIKKIEDPEVLIEIARSDPEESLRRAAQDRADDLLLGTVLSAQDQDAAQATLGKLSQRALLEVARRAQHGGVRQLAAELIGDERLLGELARTSNDPALRLSCLERVRSESVLRDVALGAAVKEVALQALERIQAPELLRDIAERGKSKALRAAAQQRLGGAPERRPSPSTTKAALEKHRRAQLLSLCQRAEAAARAADLRRAEAELAQVQAEWEALGSQPGDEPLRQRIDQAVAALQARREAAQRKEAQARLEADNLRRERERCQRRTALCERVEQLDGEGVPIQLAEVRKAWDDLGPAETPAERELARRFARAVKEAMRRHEQAESRRAARARLEEIVAEVKALGSAPGDVKRLRALEGRWRELEAQLPPGDELRQRYEEAVQSVRAAIEEAKQKRQAEAEAVRAQCETLCASAEGLVETGNRQQVEAALKQVQAMQQQLRVLSASHRKALAERLHQARERLTIRLKDLREEEDWRRWSAVPQAEALCQRLEALSEVKDIKQLRREVQAARVAWKKLGPLPKERSQALWQRFKAAIDAVSTQIDGQAGLDPAVLADNLKKKEALCQRAEALAESTDWKATAEELKRLQGEWKQIGPAPRAAADAVWKRFRAACDRFFERRKQHQAGDAAEEAARAEALARLTALCQRAEALAESTQWRETAEELKAMQVQWKQAGPAPRAEADALWKRFRAACDRFFERRKEHHAQLEAERIENLRKKEALCLEVEQLFDSEDMGEQEAQEAVKQYMARWKTIGPAPKKQSDAVWERFRAACDRLLLRQWLPPELGSAQFANRPLQDLGRRLGQIGDAGQGESKES
ncbi:MAG: DUF349 domain-containing protein [Myxococcota bacterium]|nr:DUF349 domain-containing protein [Myxococcota bacterium]